MIKYFKFNAFSSSGFIFKNDPTMTSFNNWNHRLCKIFKNDSDWDQELATLSVYYHQFASSLTAVDDGSEEYTEDEEEMQQELVCSQQLTSRQLNFKNL